MKKKLFSAVIMAAILVFTGCGNADTVLDGPGSDEQSYTTESESEYTEEDNNSEDNNSGDITRTDETANNECPLEDGIYTATFDTDSSMFHVNETLDNKGILTVENGEMTIHVVLAGKGVLNLYAGLADDAKKDGAVLLQPVVEEVTYPDGLTEEAHAFDIPVPYLDEVFNVALIGKKEVWYDHEVSVSDVEPYSADSSYNTEDSEEITGSTVEVTLEGGTGKVSIASPAKIVEDGEGYILTVVLSSTKYDYMIVDGVKYLPVTNEGGSVFEIPVNSFDEPLEVIGDTIAMSEPHEIEYTIVFGEVTLK